MDEPVDFSLIEGQKENIQSLPGGRSARALAAIISPGAASNASSSSGLNETSDMNATIRNEYEDELRSIDESDDPLDIYDRYVKWTIEAYPAAQATPQSGLLPLLERATKAFLSSQEYKNDPRYLRLWLQYIRLFSDDPREIFVFLIWNGIGEKLALLYEEFAAWLETVGRCAQAEQVYEMGLEKAARPAERLSRKYHEFQKRTENRSRAGEPTSPILPRVRPALQAKTDPYATARDPGNHQAASGANGSKAPTAARKGKPKMKIFSDADGAGNSVEDAPSTTNHLGDTIGLMRERKKENTYEPKPWKGQTLKGAGCPERGPKLQVYKDESLARANALITEKTLQLRETVNPRSGRVERIFVDLTLLYSQDARGAHTERSIDEARAQSRGWLTKHWPRPKLDKQRSRGLELRPSKQASQGHQQDDAFSQIRRGTQAQRSEVPTKDKSDLQQSSARATEKRRSSKPYETSTQTQTIKAKLDSPTNSRVRRRTGSAEPTMTLHTRAATDEIYGIFNQPLKSETRNDDDSPYHSEGFDEDDFTTSTNLTQRVSLSASELCEGEGDATCTSRTFPDSETPGDVTLQASASASDWTAHEVSQQGSWAMPSGTQSPSIDAVTQEVAHPAPDNGRFSQETSGGLSSSSAAAQPRDPPMQSRLHFMTPIAERTEMSLHYTAQREPRWDYQGSSHVVEEGATQDQQDLALTSSEHARRPIKGRIPIFRDTSPSPRAKVAATRPTSCPTALQEALNRPPMVSDSKCDPVAEAIKRRILNAIEPHLEGYPGFHRYAKKGDEYFKRIKDGVGKRLSDSGNNHKPVAIQFDDTGTTYACLKFLGKGGFASVYLAELMSQGHDVISPEPANSRQQALKIEESLNSSWEFYMLRTAAARLQMSTEHSRCVDSVLKAYEMHCFHDMGYLTVEYSKQGTLLDLVNTLLAQPWLVSKDEAECLAMFFSAELFRVIGGLHACGILHGDIKADNCLVRLKTTSTDDAAHDALESYSAHEGSTWAHNGIKLIDFGRGIDMTAFRTDVQFFAEWKAGAHECPEMREHRPWTHQVDLWGIANIMHLLLFQKDMETTCIPARPGGRPRYQLKERIKRYWEQDTWHEAFDLCLNPLDPRWGDIERAASASDTPMGENAPPAPILPVTASMMRIRQKMEAWLEANAAKKNLHTRLKQLDDLMSKRPRDKVLAGK
ncbi:hypothetical protein KEM52_001920 [Ascosphaera acerosa]|nr:hypothetical protein KEM52_001920 [Ascosphaera acerosa]